MSNENKIEFCQRNELAEKVEASVKDNERLAKMIRDLRHENHGLQTELRHRPSGFNESQSGTSDEDNGYKEKFEALVEINHGWKKDYKDLQMRYEMLSGEKRLLVVEERKPKGRVNELEKRQKPLEGEIARLAGALYATQGSNGRASPWELLKSQMVVYKDDFERGRQDRENLNEENKKYKHRLEDAEKIIRMLTAKLDACKALEQARRERGHYSENGYLSERGGIPRHQLQLVYPYHQIGEGWQMELHTLDNCIPDSLTQSDSMGHHT